MKLSTAVLVVGLLGIGLFVFSGCQQQAEQAETAGEAATEEVGHMAREGDMEPDAAMMADMPEDKAYDITCGMIIDKEGAVTAEYQGHTFYFCSEPCKEMFEAEPEKYVQKMRDMKAKAKAMQEEGEGAAKEAGETMEGM